MAETPLKRDRSEIQAAYGEETKRHKSYKDILSILEEEEEETTQDLSSLLSILQQELSAVPQNESKSLLETSETAECFSSSSREQFKNEEKDKESVIRHLLEASDDELGIPNGDNVVVDYKEEDEHVNGRDLGFAFCDGLWEIDDAAKCYSLLQFD